MAPKKKEQQQKMSLGDFMNDSGFGGGSWADEVEETYVPGTQALPSGDRGRFSSTSTWQDRGYSVRDHSPQAIPDRPPYTAHLGNLAYDITNDAVNEFLEGCDVATVRLIEDRELQRPKGFGYVEFSTVEGLKKALTYDGESFQGRTVRIKVADPPRGGDSGRGDSIREMGAWDRKGPLSDPAGGRSGGRPEYSERRPPRDNDFGGDRPARELTWERRGPLSPVAGQESSGSRDGSRPAPGGLGERGDSHRGGRRDAPPAWGEARQGGREEGSRPPRQDYPERAERTVTAAEKDMQWRDRMRPEAAKAASPDGSAPPSPALSNAAPAHGGRPRLNLAKRTVSEATDAGSISQAPSSKASPFGAARPIDTAAKEKLIEEKRLQAIQDKKEADEKAKEERRLAKEAAAKAEAEAAEAAEAEAAAAAAAAEAAKEAAAEAEAEAAKVAKEAASQPKEEVESAEKANGEQKVPVRTREPREPREPRSPREPRDNVKSRAAESSSWRSAGSEQRGPRGGARGGRGGGASRGSRNDTRPARANGSSAQQTAAVPSGAADSEPSTPAVEDDGWTTVPRKARGGRA
ncbi:Eukaryotic translation initiation factor 4B [Neonectria magnoliae]|uniref:Eukaryotic translation initiation factor 4B n=1 Tax=Neonectria magnoliae TaxID=2732573 RepID=A0ABR1HLV7_9HYPO